MNLKKVFLINWYQKLISLLFALGLFLYVNNMKSTYRIINVPLTITNKPKFLIPVKKPLKMIQVKISGTMHKIAMVEARHIKAIVDMSKAKKGINVFNIYLKYAIFSDDIDVSTSKKNLKVEMDWLRHKKVNILPVIINKPADGYKVEKIELTPVNVVLEGPASVLRSIKSIPIIPVNISGLRRNLRKIVELNYRGLNVRTIGQKKIEINLTLQKQDGNDRYPVKVYNLHKGLVIKNRDSLSVKVILDETTQLKKSFLKKNIGFNIDLSGYNKPGEYKVRVNVKFKGNIKIKKIIPAEILIVLTKGIK